MPSFHEVLCRMRGRGINMDDILVSICCLAYNHQDYIAQAIDSFLRQKTKFPFEIIVHDDASTDRTPEIIKEYEKKYPGVVRAIYQKENQYSKIKRIEMFYLKAARGKYIAICEGDDFWIDEDKLQIQLDYMEKNPECSLCTHGAIKIHKEKISGTIRPDTRSRSFSTADVILGEGGMFATNSMFFPTELAKYMPDFYFDCPVGDYPLAIYLSLQGDVHYIDRFMSAYREMAKNSWSSNMKGNLELKVNHNRQIEKMLNEVNHYTDYAYSDAVYRRIMLNRFDLLMEQGKYGELRKGEYLEYYKAMKAKGKAKVLVKQHLPYTTQIIRNLKRKMYG